MHRLGRSPVIKSQTISLRSSDIFKSGDFIAYCKFLLAVEKISKIDSKRAQRKLVNQLAMA